MSIKTVWQCDRCRSIWDVPNSSGEPQDWAALFEFSPPKQATEHVVPDPPFHVCANCREELHQWLEEPPR